MMQNIEDVIGRGEQISGMLESRSHCIHSHTTVLSSRAESLKTHSKEYLKVGL